LLLITLLYGAITGCTVAVSAAGPQPGDAGPQGQGTAGVQVTLSAAQSTVSWDGRLDPVELFELPLLYLHREREAATQAQRTLEVRVSGLGGGTKVALEAMSRHVNVATGERHREITTALLPDRPCTFSDPCTLNWTLDPETMLSDFYTLRVNDEAGNLLWQRAGPDRPDFIALDTWDVGIDDYTVRVTYATLFPFARGQNDLEDRLPPDAVTDFVEQQFLPLIVETWHTQFHAWGFGPIHPDWDPDKVVEIFVTAPPFALFDGTGTYTSSVYADGRPYPERRLWWLSNNNAFQTYDSLENGYKAVYAHEFFHLVQWNVVLSAGCSTGKWQNVFIEAQGKFAPSVQYPELEIHGNHMVGSGSEYGSAARRYLGLGLNTSYRALESDRIHMYDAALYWRFLYEQFGDMRVIRAALEEMACRYQPDIVTSMRDVMDAALARSGGPIGTYEGSLIAFAQANYALRLEDGRCAASDLMGCLGWHYDPHYMYTDPPVEAELDYNGATLTYDGAISASFGMDFLEVSLDRGLTDQPIQITVRSHGARLDVRVWRLGGGGALAASPLAKLGGEGTRPRGLTLQPESTFQGGDGLHTFLIPRLDPAKNDRLALIITRLDSHEGTDVVGDYTIRVWPKLVGTGGSPRPYKPDSHSFWPDSYHYATLAH
jgi:hypothetical protein